MGINEMDTRSCAKLQTYPVALNEAGEIVVHRESLVLMEQERATAGYN